MKFSHLLLPLLITCSSANHNDQRNKNIRRREEAYDGYLGTNLKQKLISRANSHEQESAAQGQGDLSSKLTALLAKHVKEAKNEADEMTTKDFTVNNDEKDLSTTNDHETAEEELSTANNNGDTDTIETLLDDIPAAANDETELSVNDEAAEMSVEEEEATDLSVNDETEMSVNDETEMSVNEEETELSVNEEETELSINEEETELSVNEEETELSVNEEETELSVNDAAEMPVNDETEMSVNEEETELSVNDEAEMSVNDEAEMSVNDEAEMSVNEEGTKLSVNEEETELSINEEVTETELETKLETELETDLSANEEEGEAELETKPETELETDLSANEEGTVNEEKTQTELETKLETELESHLSLNNEEKEMSANEEETDDKSNLSEYDQTGIASAVVQSRSRDDVKEALNTYFDSLQVALGYASPPSDQDKVKEMMAPFVKEVQWALGVMHPGFDKDLVTDDVIINQMSKIAGKNNRKRKSDNENRRKLENGDTAMCLEKTRDILSISMRLAYYGLYGDLHSSDEMIQNSGKDIADQLDVEEARERFRTLGPLQKNEDDYRLIAKEAFKFAESEVGLDGIINYGMKSWSPNNFWATGFFASEMWASALQISVFDTFPISSQTFTANPDSSITHTTGVDAEGGGTLDTEFAAMIDAYNDHCATCPTGWTDNGVSKHGLHCTTGFSPTCDGNCLEQQCNSAKGKWENVNLEFNPYTCYMSVCPTGWSNIGRKEKGLMCTMHRSHACDESCAEVQCEDVGGSFPLAIDDVADNPYVCFV